MTKVIAFGTFDILHPGHEHALKEAKALGDELVVIIARDQTVERVKNRKALNTESVRRENVEKLGIATKVRLGGLGHPHDVIKEEQPDIIALGYDQKFFIENLDTVLTKSVKIVHLEPFHPEKYKSSKLRDAV